MLPPPPQPEDTPPPPRVTTPPPQPELTGGGAGRGAGREGVLTDPPPQPLEAVVRLLVDEVRARFNSSAEVDFGFPFALGLGLHPADEVLAPQPVATGWRLGVVLGLVEPTPQPEAALGRLFPPRLTVVMSGSPSARGASGAPGVSRLPSVRSGTSCRAR